MNDFIVHFVEFHYGLLHKMSDRAVSAVGPNFSKQWHYHAAYEAGWMDCLRELREEWAKQQKKDI